MNFNISLLIMPIESLILNVQMKYKAMGTIDKYLLSICQICRNCITSIVTMHEFTQYTKKIISSWNIFFCSLDSCQDSRTEGGSESLFRASLFWRLALTSNSAFCCKKQLGILLLWNTVIVTGYPSPSFPTELLSCPNILLVPFTPWWKEGL